MPRCGRGLTLRDSCLVAPSFRVMQSRRKGGAKRYPSVPVFVSDGFRFALPIADTISRSRGVDRPRFASSFGPLRNRGRREDRVLAAPAVSRIARPGACCTRGLANCANKRAHEHTGQLEHSGLPCAMVLRLTSCSSQRTAFLPPSPALLIARLAPAPRRPNHTTSPYASGAYV
jgi:hypothetical protein